MKVLHISTDDIIGGAAIAAFRLNEAMIQNGIDSKLLVANKKSHSNNVIAVFSPIKRILYSIYAAVYSKMISRLFKTSYMFSLGKSFSSITKHPLIKEADIIYIHWVQNNFLGIKAIEQILKTNKPIILYMHDMWDITGGCHHSFECNSYTIKCKNCPIIQRKIFKEYSQRIIKKKEKHWGPYNNLYFITPSSWLSNCVKNSLTFKSHSITTIPNLIDTQKFRPHNKELTREILGLPKNKKLLLFGANNGTANIYKGWTYLKEALTMLNDKKNIEIVLFGGTLTSEEAKSLIFPIHSLGYITDVYSLVLMYNAVDVYINPSLAESFGMTTLEAISCGTYAVSFAVGGLTDIIRHKETGYLASYKNTNDLANGIEWCLNETSNEKPKDLHQYVIDNFSYNKIIGTHKELYNRFTSKYQQSTPA